MISSSPYYDERLKATAEYVAENYGKKFQPYRDSIIMFFARRNNLSFDDLLMAVSDIEPIHLPPYGGEAIRW